MIGQARLGALAAIVISCVSLLPGAARANEFVRRFGGPGSGNGQFSQPVGVGLDASSGDVYVSDSTRTPVQTLTTTASGATWSVTPGAALAPGTYTAQARQGDKAGNSGGSTPSTFTIT